MSGRRFEPSWRDRILTAVAVAVVGAVAFAGSSLMTDPVSVMSLLCLIVAVVNTRLAIEPWRGHVAADDEGITVHPGIGPVQHGGVAKGSGYPYRRAAQPAGDRTVRRVRHPGAETGRPFRAR